MRIPCHVTVFCRFATMLTLFYFLNIIVYLSAIFACRLFYFFFSICECVSVCARALFWFLFVSLLKYVIPGLGFVQNGISCILHSVFTHSHANRQQLPKNKQTRDRIASRVKTANWISELYRVPSADFETFALAYGMYTISANNVMLNLDSFRNTTENNLMRVCVSAKDPLMTLWYIFAETNWINFLIKEPHANFNWQISFILKCAKQEYNEIKCEVHPRKRESGWEREREIGEAAVEWKLLSFWWNGTFFLPLSILILNGKLCASMYFNAMHSNSQTNQRKYKNFKWFSTSKTRTVFLHIHSESFFHRKLTYLNARSLSLSVRLTCILSLWIDGFCDTWCISREPLVYSLLPLKCCFAVAVAAPVVVVNVVVVVCCWFCWQWRRN